MALLLVVAVFAAERWQGIDTTAERSPVAEQDQSSGSFPSSSRVGDNDEFSAQGLPPEAIETLRLIEAGGPFPYDRDGTTFQNREGRLPSHPRGYYREYTVTTPGSRDRGARRIVSGGDPPTVFYYTDDHYRSFRRIEVPDR
jgi:guanyl-specific ribonuclease Sa